MQQCEAQAQQCEAQARQWRAQMRQFQFPQQPMQPVDYHTGGLAAFSESPLSYGTSDTTMSPICDPFLDLASQLYIVGMPDPSLMVPEENQLWLETMEAEVPGEEC